jgi:DNA-binding response OmpR family regulator
MTMEGSLGPILLAEADSVFGDLASAYLTSRGYRVVRVRDGRRALEALGLERFHAIVAGLELAGLDGLELASCALLSPVPPPVVLTTRDPGMEHANLDAAGVKAVVTRPCRLSVLVAVIEDVTRAEEEPRATAALAAHG